MYIIKNICLDHKTECLEIEKGIPVGITPPKAVSMYGWWGKTEIHLGDNVDYTKFPSAFGALNLLSYTNKYEVEDLNDGLKKFKFDVNEYEENNIEGYIIFVRFAHDDLKTNGEKLFGRVSTEIVVLLKEGDFLEYDNERIEVIGGQLKDRYDLNEMYSLNE